jgi:hypothetical protein
MILHKYNLTVKDAILFSVIISFWLFITGFATIPFAAHYDIFVQNIVYLLGRIPVIFFGVLVYLKVKEVCNE